MRLSHAVLLTLLVTATSLHAGAGRPIQIYAAGELAQPVGDLHDRVDGSPGGSLGLGYAPGFISTGEIEFVLRGGYERFNTNRNYGPDFRFITIGLDFKLNLTAASTSNYYLLLGAGYSHTGQCSFDVPGYTFKSHTEHNPYLSAGVGVEYRRNPVSPFVQIRFTDVSGKQIGDYQFFKFALGLKL